MTLILVCPHGKKIRLGGKEGFAVEYCEKCEQEIRERLNERKPVPAKKNGKKEWVN
jgi:hypothetical protein